MSAVEFDTERQAALQRLQSFQNSNQGSSSKFVKWLMDKGIVKTEQGGQKVLLGIVVLNIIVTILVVIYFI